MDEDAEESAPREFHFRIEDDSNFQGLLSRSSSASVSPSEPGQSAESVSVEYIVSKLFNFMKISEIHQYGISVFEATFSSFLPFLSEVDLFRLATSYWCNADHFDVMVRRRGHEIKGDVLSLPITDELLDAAMQSGSAADKIEAMLLQRRRDRAHEETAGDLLFAPSKDEKAFFRRNLKHRLWSHEVLGMVFVRNGWLTPDLAEYALASFSSAIYRRALQSEALRPNNSEWLELNDAFLTAFFADHFGRDIPEMFGRSKRKKERAPRYHLREEALRRWCSFIELLASRGAKGADHEFFAVPPLRYALIIGTRTFSIISASHQQRNRWLIPEHWQNITVPDDIWDVMMGYL